MLEENIEDRVCFAFLPFENNNVKYLLCNQKLREKKLRNYHPKDWNFVLQYQNHEIISNFESIRSTAT